MGIINYKTTEKGLNLLKMHNEIGELLQVTASKMTINFYSNSIFVSI